MKRLTLSTSLIVLLLMILVACDSSTPLADNSSPVVFTTDQIATLNTYDTKSYNEVADRLLGSWTFQASPDSSLASDHELIISIGMSANSVSEEMLLAADLYWRSYTYFEFGPHGTQFLRTIEVSTALGYWDIPDGIDLNDLSYFYVDDQGTRNPHDDTFTPVPSFIQDFALIGEFDHFSKYAIGVIPN